MLLILAALLAAGTIVESLYTSSIAKRFVYGTWWFGAFLFLLAVNVLLSALSRYPWKKHQTGFVITHIGILLILAGSWVTQKWGTDGQIAVAEGATGAIFQEDKPLLTCRVDSGEAKRFAAGFPFLAPRPIWPRVFQVAPDASVKVDRFYLNAQKVVEAAPPPEGQKGTPAVHVSLESSFAGASDWLFLGKADYNRLDLGPASVFLDTSAHWPLWLKQEGAAFPSNALVILKMPSGAWAAKVRHRGLWGTLKPLAPGKPLQTGWMDMKATLTETKDPAVPDIRYAPSPLEPQKEPQPAIHFEARQGPASAEGWMGYEDQMSFNLGPHAWELSYGPRQASLPFSVQLIKFKLGLDPGTQNPASYASDVVVRGFNGAAGQVFDIHMNHPLHQSGYTLYQASYFPSGHGKYTSVFSVGRDPGLALKYVGALGLVLGIIFMFWFKNPAWKKKESDEIPPPAPPAAPAA